MRKTIYFKQMLAVAIFLFATSAQAQGLKDLLNKAFDRPLHEYIYDAFKGFEILPNIKILGYEWVPDEDKYDVNDHVIRRNSNKNKTIKHLHHFQI